MIYEYDFTRCVRPNGTSYGTSGQCRQGVEDEKQAIDQLLNLLPKGEIVVDSRGKEVSRFLRKSNVSEENLSTILKKEKRLESALIREKALLRSLRSTSESEGYLKERQNRVERIENSLKKMKDKRIKMDSQLEAEAARSGIPRTLLPFN
jgi:hypothetical protein